MEYHERESATLKIERDHWREQAKAWEAVARNLAQVLEGRDGDGVLTLSQQVKAHGLMGTQSAPERLKVAALAQHPTPVVSVTKEYAIFCRHPDGVRTFGITYDGKVESTGDSPPDAAARLFAASVGPLLRSIVQHGREDWKARPAVIECRAALAKAVADAISGASIDTTGGRQPVRDAVDALCNAVACS